MNTFTSAIKKTGEGLGGAVSDLNRGVQGIGDAVGRGVKGSDPNRDRDTPSEGDKNTPSQAKKSEPETAGDASGSGNNAAPPGTESGGGGFFGTITSGVTSGVSSVFAPTADLAKSGITLTRDATSAGLSIGQNIAQSGLDMGVNVVTGTASLAGTALGGIIDAAAETSGAVFEPVGSGLKAIQGLDKLGQGVEAINGLSLGAIRTVGDLTTKALNMSGKTPTFFDPDADGIVGVPDTVRGLVLLGLDEKNAKYAAYALHTVFSYPTSDSWVPALDTTLPIYVAKMSKTRWGKNWGNFERLDWVDDVEIDKFFVPEKDEKQWSDYWKQGRQGFGILLLIFEWGTTWPFYMPPVPVHEIPFANDIGKVVRKAILPTIMSNFKKVRAADPDAKNRQPSKMPSGDVPTTGKDA